MEPMPQAVGSLTKAMAAGLPVHKLILMDTKEAIERLRPVLEASVGEKATLTQVKHHLQHQPMHVLKLSMTLVCYCAGGSGLMCAANVAIFLVAVAHLECCTDRAEKLVRPRFAMSCSRAPLFDAASVAQTVVFEIWLAFEK